MQETEVEIPDQPTQPVESSAEEESPYRNLWVPLIVVPAGIVMVIVIVFALFGSLTGEERTLQENLMTVIDGGKNEREQALFSLMQQVSENRRALNQGEDPPWEVEPGFTERVVDAVERTQEDEFPTRLALGGLLIGMDAPERGVDVLLPLLSLGEGEDPGAKLRFQAAQNLGFSGDALAVPALIKVLDSDDEGLRVVAAMSLGNLPGDAVRGALVASLGDSALAVRGTAAMALAQLSPPATEARPTLQDLTGTDVYEAERQENPAKYSRASDVSRFRINALKALARLGEASDWEHIAGLKSDGDPNVVDTVLRLLQQREDG